MAPTQSPTRTTSPPADGPRGRRRRWLLLGGLAVVVALAAGVAAGLAWYFDDDAPAEVSLATATAALVDRGGPGVAGATTGEGGAGGAPTAGIEGTWRVDPSIGSVGHEEATGSFAGFRIEEELRGIGSATAVGRTPAVSGTLSIEGTELVDATVEADLTALTTNDSRRDDRALGALDVQQHPTASFVLTEPIELGEDAASGEPVRVTAHGDLTVHGVTRPVAWPLEAQLVGDTIVVVGALEVSFADYGVETPSAQVVLSVEDHGVMEVQLLLTRG